VFVDAVTVIDQDLVTGAVHTLAMNTLTGYRNAVPVKWNDAELALYLVYSYGEINKSERPPAFNRLGDAVVTCVSDRRDQRSRGVRAGAYASEGAAA
jgi:hypothetical protein